MRTPALLNPFDSRGIGKHFIHRTDISFAQFDRTKDLGAIKSSKLEIFLAKIIEKIFSPTIRIGIIAKVSLDKNYEKKSNGG